MALIAFEGLDQSGKETQAKLLRDELERRGRSAVSVTFPSDRTSIGQEIRAALAGTRNYPPDVMQLLFIANRHEWRPRIEQWLRDGVVVICDRYRASSIAYGEALGLDPVWLSDTQRLLPSPTLTILLDIPPETALARKRAARDRYERDLNLLARVRESYRRQAQDTDWLLLDGERPRDAVAADVTRAVLARLEPP
jgi:dTMP kinase